MYLKKLSTNPGNYEKVCNPVLRSDSHPDPCVDHREEIRGTTRVEIGDRHQSGRTDCHNE